MTMKDLLKWEFKNLLRSKAFWGMGIAFLVCTFLFLLIPLHNGDHTGYEMYLENLNNFNSLMLFLTGIFAGIHVTGAFEERKIQAAVMAGNSRFSILLAKAASFAAAMTAYFITSVGITSVIGFAATEAGEMDGTFLSAVIIRALVFMLVEISYSSICILISMLIKNLGGAIAVNLITLLSVYCFGEVLLGLEWGAKILQFTPCGQLFYMFMDVSAKNMMIALAVSVIGFAAVLGLSYLKFSREELK